ncbi:MAG: N-6 DNA methylase [Bacteroidota bacterium]
MNEDIKRRIEQSLRSFAQGDLTKNSIGLFQTLGYATDRQAPLDKPTYSNFKDSFVQVDSRFNEEKAQTKEWKCVNLLFQLTKDEVSRDKSLFDTKQVDRTIIETYLFFVIELARPEYSRTALSHITREVNRLFPMPTLVLFKHGGSLTLSVIDRRLHKRDEAKDVLEKVTLIKDINITSPHRAHIDILFDLSLPELTRRHSPTNFVELHGAWRATLNISELNKKFYREIAAWYFWAVRSVKFPLPSKATNEKANREINVIRLLTRLIFAWFLKEKNLLPDDLFDRMALSKLLREFDPTSGKKSVYYKAILQNLFFATLNQKMNTKEEPDNRRFRSNKRGYHNYSEDYGVKNLYRYEELFSDTGTALNLFSSVPFLNGGLFDCLDKEDPDKKNLIVHIDGFSDVPANQPTVPDEVFFGQEGEIDLSEVYDDRRKKHERVRGLVHILKDYKFTIAENTPVEEEIALDPELLGQIFENLLAEYVPETGTTARKRTGSFYTPREIVNYMVDESLLAYLREKMLRENPAILDVGSEQSDAFGNKARKGQLRLEHKLEPNRWHKISEKLDNELRKLLSYTDESLDFTERDTEALIEAIHSMRVLDPACGSGAFVMGVLLKVVHVLHKLDPENSRWKEQQLAAVKDMTAADLRRGTVERIEEAFSAQNNYADYSRKLFLIEDCIYGVDIQPIAVQIAKLRFFISLLVDQKNNDQKPNRGVLSLPNLETKFVAANTLVSLGGQDVLKPKEFHEFEEKLRRVRHEYFNARTRKDKLHCIEEDRKLRLVIAETLKNLGMPKSVIELLAHWDPYDQNGVAGFFSADWMFSLDKGFDVVIGNPPYLRVQGLQQTQPEFIPYYRERYKSATGNFDLYALFIERGYELLSITGMLAYIVPHKFFQASFGEGLRRLLTAKKALAQVVRFGAAQVFEESTTYTCLLFLSAKEQREFDLLEVKSLENGEEVLQHARWRNQHPEYVFETLPEPEKTDWDFSIGESGQILKRMHQHPKKLGELTHKIFQGLATSADKLYVLEIRHEEENTYRCYSRYNETEFEIEKALVKPFLMGKDVHRYEPAVARNVVIFPYHIDEDTPKLMTAAFLKKEAPLGWKYLKGNRDALAGRERGKMDHEEFYAYIYPKNLTAFESIKIMTPEISLGCNMTLDFEGRLYHTTKVYSFVFKDTKKTPTKYMLGLLNSRVLWFFLMKTGYVLRGGYYTFKTDYLKPFPIPDSSKEHQQSIETLVEYVLHLKAKPGRGPSETAQTDLMTAFFEQLIDGIVYELYFPEEFKSLDRSVARMLAHNPMPPLASLKGNKKDAIEGVFKNVYDRESEIRKASFFIESIESARIIENATRKK